MVDPERFDARAYVAAAAPLVGLALTPERIEQVAAALALIVRIGAPALAVNVPAEVEPAPVFTP
jgi:1-carboxybiuret hydrolase subunit AtzG-like protein